MKKGMMADKQIIQAQKMRNEGKIAYRKIAAIMSVPYTTLYAALNPRAKELNRKSCKKYYKANREQLLTDKKSYDRAHREQRTIYNKRKYQNNREEERVRNAEYYRVNRESALAKAKEYAKTHLPELAAISSARRALILGATVGNLAEIKEVYRIAKESRKVRCYLCGKLIPLGHRHVDHIMPLSKGGAHRPSNLAAACDKCNMSKHDKVPNEIGVLI